MKRGFFFILCALVVFILLPAFALVTAERGFAKDSSSAEKTVRFDEVWPPRLDPALGQDFSSSILYANIYDSLVFPKPDGTVQPHAADSWQVSSDGLRYTFTLKKGIKFHNGEELTADDVVFSANRLMKIGEGYAYLFAPIVDKVTTDGAYKVTFTMKKASEYNRRLEIE